MAETVEVRNVNHPDARSWVDAARYALVREAMLTALPDAAPGMTAKALREAMLPAVAEGFPGGAKLGWWETTVRLDLEARNLVARSSGSPLRFWRVRG